MYGTLVCAGVGFFIAHDWGVQLERFTSAGDVLSNRDTHHEHQYGYALYGSYLFSFLESQGD